MNKKKNYIPLEIDILDIQMEKGYAISGGYNEGFGTTPGGW